MKNLTLGKLITNKNNRDKLVKLVISEKDGEFYAVPFVEVLEDLRDDFGYVYAIMPCIDVFDAEYEDAISRDMVIDIDEPEKVVDEEVEVVGEVKDFYFEHIETSFDLYHAKTNVKKRAKIKKIAA